MRRQFLLNGVGESGGSDVIGRSFHEEACQVLTFCVQDSSVPVSSISTKNTHRHAVYDDHEYDDIRVCIEHQFDGQFVWLYLPCSCAVTFVFFLDLS